MLLGKLYSGFVVPIKVLIIPVALEERLQYGHWSQCVLNSHVLAMLWRSLQMRRTGDVQGANHKKGAASTPLAFKLYSSFVVLFTSSMTSMATLNWSRILCRAAVLTVRRFGHGGLIVPPSLSCSVNLCRKMSSFLGISWLTFSFPWPCPTHLGWSWCLLQHPASRGWGSGLRQWAGMAAGWI